MKENVYKHLIITKTDVQDSVSVLRKTWKTIRCKVTRGKKSGDSWDTNIQIKISFSRKMTRFQTRWMQLVCVLFVGEQSLQKYYINACKKNIYSVYKYFEFINCIYMYNIHFVFIAHRAGWLFMSILTFSRPRIPLNLNRIAFTFLLI